MLHKSPPFHGAILFGLVGLVGLLSVGRSLWLSAQVNPARQPAPVSLDLTGLRWHARLGFSEADRGGFDPNSAGVQVLRAWPVHLNDEFAIPSDGQVRAFALMTTFDLPPEALTQALALNLAELGDNWAVYLNGQELRREIFLTIDGRMMIHRSQQRVFIWLPPSAVQVGENTLVIELVGDAPPTSWAPGFSMSTGYWLAPAAAVVRERAVADAISWLQIGVYFFVGLNYLLIFWRQREQYALYFGMFLFTCVTYSLVYSNLAIDLIPDSAIITRVMYVSNLASPGLIGLTLWNYLYPERAISPILRVLAGISAGGCLVICLAPYPWLDQVLNVFLLAVLASILYLIGMVYRAWREGNADAGIILVTHPVISLMVLWAIVDLWLLRTNIDLTGWIPFFLAVAFALIFVDRFWRLNRDLRESNRQLALSRDHLEERVQARSVELRAANAELDEANHHLSESELRLRRALEEVHQANTDLERRVEERTAELRVAKEAAEAASRAKTAFLAVMGHELRTPLNGIFLAAEMLRNEAAMLPEHRDLPDHILTSGRRLLKMVEGILEYTAPDSRRKPALTDVEPVLYDVVASFESRAMRQGLSLVWSIGQGLPPIGLESHPFEQVLRRLLDNALRFTPAGGRVTVKAESIARWAFADGDRAALRITVTDTGPGLEPQDVERIFEPFVQLESSYLQHSEGVGLGLTLARRQVELYGGRLWAESEGLGKGSVFIIILPAITST